VLVIYLCSHHPFSSTCLLVTDWKDVYGPLIDSRCPAFPSTVSHQDSPKAPEHAGPPGPVGITADLNNVRTLWGCFNVQERTGSALLSYLRARSLCASVLNGDERVVSSCVPPFSPVRLPIDWSTHVNQQVQLEGRIMCFCFRFQIMRFQSSRYKWWNMMGRVHAMLSSTHRLVGLFGLSHSNWAKHDITPWLIHKLTPSESKRREITLHQTGTFHIHSLFVISSP